MLLNNNMPLTALDYKNLKQIFTGELGTADDIRENLGYSAIFEAFKALGGVKTIYEINEWVRQKYGDVWKDYRTPMADMVPISRGGNSSSKVREELRVLERVAFGEYRLIM